MITLPDVRISVTDGGLGLLPQGVTNHHAKVGVSSAGVANAIVEITDAADIAAQFGTGPLADALLDSLTAGATSVYAVRAAGDVAGTLSAVQSTKTGTGDMAVTGQPLNAFDARVEILSDGGRNQATFRYSLDGGDTYSSAITVPATGAFPVPDTGLTLTFTEDAVTPVNSFKTGDVYTFTATAPQASVTSVNAAIDALLASSLQFAFIHVVGASDASLWTALATRADEAAQAYRYIRILCEARGPNAGETVDAWVTALETAAATFSSPRVAVAAGRVELLDGVTQRQVERNCAGLFAGRVSALAPQVSAARVKDGPLPSVVRLAPTGLSPAQIARLDTARYITVREYIGLLGVYLTNGRLMALDTSDFRYWELGQVMDKACTLVRARALTNMQAEATPAGLAALEADLTAPLDLMTGAGEIAAGQVVIPKDQDIVATSTVRAKVRIQPVGIFRDIEVEIGFQAQGV